MPRKFERDEPHLERTLWMLKDRKWGAVKGGREGWKVADSAEIDWGRH
jgi:hypothetical protein